MNHKETILEEAARIVNGDRAQDYGDSNEMLARIAALWMPVLRDCVWDEGEVPGANIELCIEPRHVALCLIQLKVAREINSPKRDNAVDIAGYAELLGRVEDERGAGYGSEQNFGGSPEPMRLEEFRKAVWGVHNRPADLSCIAAFNSYLNQLATVAGWSKLVTDCPAQDRGMFIDHITVAAGLIDGGYSPETTDYLGEGNGFETRWVFSSKTDPQNEKTDSENPKCEATEAKSEANYGVHYSGIRAGMSEEANPAEIMRSLAKAAADDLGLSVDHQSFDAAAAALESPIENNPAAEEPQGAEPKPEATPKFKLGDGVYHRIRKTYGKVLQYPFGGGHLVGGLHFVAWTDGRNSVELECDLLEEPQGAETPSEAPKAVNVLNIDIGAGYDAMAKTFVRAIPSPFRLLGKHPALGASYELGKGDIAGLSPDSPFRAGGIFGRGEAILPKGEEATAAGEAWTPMPGDKVRVVRKIKSHGGWNNYWVDLMDGAVGQVGRVKDFTDEDLRDNAVQLEFDGDPAWSDFWYPIPALERVTDAED